MRDDEVRARQQLEEIKVILKDSKLKMREYNLPVIPQSYYIELSEASSAIREIVKELQKRGVEMSTGSFSNKINCKSPFNQIEIIEI